MMMVMMTVINILTLTLEDDDPLVVDDERGYEGVVYVTDIDNPKIVVGVTFEDGFCFKRCIRQYVVLNEVELAVPYSESRRYRAHYMAKRCRWRIHASQCQEGRHGRYALISEFDLVFDSGLNEVVYSLFTLFSCFTCFY